MSDGSTILLVDDDPDIREVLATLLTFHGWHVEEAADGLEALALVRLLGPPALILLDLMLPRMSGPEFARALRQEQGGAEIPIVILSGDRSACATAKALGIRECLVKPVELDTLLDSVRRYLPPAEPPSAPSA